MTIYPPISMMSKPKPIDAEGWAEAAFDAASVRCYDVPVYGDTLGNIHRLDSWPWR